MKRVLAIIVMAAFGMVAHAQVLTPEMKKAYVQGYVP